MDWWLIIVLLGGTALIALRLWVGPPHDDAADLAWLEDDAAHLDAYAADEDILHPREPELWEAEALARWGTETTVEQLIAEGRADELRGLGYTGDLPDS